jgi:hypothetical protein
MYIENTQSHDEERGYWEFCISSIIRRVCGLPEAIFSRVEENSGVTHFWKVPYISCYKIEKQKANLSTG